MSESFGVIYKITNKINGKIYIGQTTQSLEIRWRQHCTDKRSGCRSLRNAIKKYNKENFNLKTIAECKSLDEMNQLEPYYIKKFDTLSPSGYNLRTGGDNSLLSEETKLKISESGKIVQNTPKVARKRNKALRIAMKRPETRKKMRDNHADFRGNNHPLYGKYHSKESKKKMSKNHANVKGIKNPFYAKHHTKESLKKFSGENSSISKLTQKQVNKIRNLYLSGNYSYKTLGNKFCVCNAHIFRIVKNKCWKTR